jgi:hypothetical protein
LIDGILIDQQPPKAKATPFEEEQVLDIRYLTIHVDAGAMA